MRRDSVFCPQDSSLEKIMTNTWLPTKPHCSSPCVHSHSPRPTTSPPGLWRPPPAGHRQDTETEPGRGQDAGPDGKVCVRSSCRRSQTDPSTSVPVTPQALTCWWGDEHPMTGRLVCPLSGSELVRPRLAVSTVGRWGLHRQGLEEGAQVTRPQHILYAGHRPETRCKRAQRPTKGQQK